MRIARVLAFTTVVAGLGALPAVAEPLGEPIKIEIPAPFDGAPDVNDPPLVAQPDPAVLTLDVPAEHPWMLVSGDELPALRARILGAPADSVVGQAWQRLLAGVDDPAFAERGGTQGGLDDFPDQQWGRDDLASVGLVWQVTGDDHYLEIARELLAYAVGAGPNYGAPFEPGVDEFYIQRAHRLNGFALAYDLLAPGLDDTERAQLRSIVETLGAQHFAHAQTAWWGTISSGSNITGNNAAALGTAGLALWHELPAARSWVVRSEQLVRSYFAEGFDPEGAGVEGILYGNYGLRIPTYLENALARAGAGGLFQTGGVDHQQEWFAYEVLPGGGAVNPLNDARYYEINPTYTTWAIANGDTPQLSAWLFDNFVAKVPSAGRNVGELLPTLLWYSPSDPGFDPVTMLRESEDFATRGLVHVRSGWADGAFMAAFESRQNDWGEGVHQNQDVNSFVLYSDGAKLVVDSRYGNWLSKTTGNDPEAARTSETEAHNALVADGRTQDFLGKGDLVAFATTATLGDPGVLDVALGDARLAWTTEQPERAERVFLYVRATPNTPDYVVVADRFRQGGGSHDHTWYLHTDWRNAMTVRPDGSVRIDSGEEPGVGLDLTMVTARPRAVAIGSFTPDDAQDWARLGEEGRKTHPRLEVSSTGDAFDSIAVLVPTGRHEAAPTVRQLTAEGGLAVQVEVRPGVFDTILLATGDGPVRADGIEVEGVLGMVRTTAHGPRRVVGRHALVQGTAFGVDGAVLVAESAPVTVARR